MSKASNEKLSRLFACVGCGARGIRVAARWDDFATFFSDVGERPTPLHELDRINTLGNYEPGNVRWVLHKQNQRNMRNNRLATIDGRTQCVAAWCEELNVDRDDVWHRIRRGRTPEQALREARLA